MATNRDKMIILEKRKAFIRALDEKQEEFITNAVKEYRTILEIESATDNTKTLLRDYGYSYVGNDTYKFLVNNNDVKIDNNNNNNNNKNDNNDDRSDSCFQILYSNLERAFPFLIIYFIVWKTLGFILNFF